MTTSRLRARHLASRVHIPAACLTVLCAGITISCDGVEWPAGRIEGPRISQKAIDERVQRATTLEMVRSASAEKQILFGDLHVHTTYSVDALIYSLPLFSGEGAHPPADACDFARHCAGLDFFSINDHAEGLTPDLWQRTKESIRQCNEVAGTSGDPDMVSFMGWEWTQTGLSPETHFGHKNVIYPGLADDELPARPITSMAVGDQARPPSWVMHAGAGAIGLLGYSEYADMVSFMANISEIPDCEDGVHVRELPANCRENAATPEELFRKLSEWDLETLVIPHGLAWGIHAPPGARLDVQLTRAQHNPDMQRLIEISSGHGNSEEFRDYAEYATDPAGQRICPEPTADYLPCCWQAAEIMRARCGDLASDECEARVEEARQLTLEAGVTPEWTLPNTSAEDWLDCDQCRDCFKPTMSLRPGQTAQYAAAISNFDQREPDERPFRFRWGFISSTDNHAARAGTGFKQFDRVIMTDSRGIYDEETSRSVHDFAIGEADDPQRAQAARYSRLGQLFDSERESSFMYPGGIVAVHAEGRDRRSIWDALMRREVYGTSGPRMLLWFDLVDETGDLIPMGREVATHHNPSFVVRAAGALEQQPGCPEESLSALSPERLEHLCRDECHHPGDMRLPIVRIDVIRIRSQQQPGEPVAPLIEDPWRSFECAPNPEGCQVEFSDPEFSIARRDTSYYVRAHQLATPAINASNLRTEFDAEGNAVSVRPCYGDYRLSREDDCLAPAEERAWSSPIYVDYIDYID
ncbi:MAG: DUF3604 domain-containing protein [Deltaproteobacteria bacterium]|nr:DUF3604 domain-containing protein [Deltaproteobacteria bacterium]